MSPSEPPVGSVVPYDILLFDDIIIAEPLEVTEASFSPTNDTASAATFVTSTTKLTIPKFGFAGVSR